MLMVSTDSSVKKLYDEMLEGAKELLVLQSAAGIVSWDMETKMPPRGLSLRSQQLALLGVIGHKMLADPKNEKLLDAIEKAPGYASLDQVQRRNVYLCRKAYNEEAKLPEQLVFETERQRTIAVGIWKKAKAAKDYKMFEPELEKMIELRKKAADILMEVKGTKTPYDALIDAFEPKMTADRISKVFSGMREGLIGVLKKIEASGFKPDKSLITRPVPIDVQRKISDAAMDFIGYDTKSPNAGGRLDETEHPFTTGYYDDVRITTHYHEDRWASSLFSVMHEGGHGIYDQNYPHKWMYQPIGASASYGIHESQSRFVENMVGRSPEFLSYMLPRLKKIVGKPLRGVKYGDFVAAVNAVEPSKIRIEADEVTYGLHIIIRFEIESDIFAGKLTVDELPEVWNKKYEDYLGVEVENDSEGVMQDTHWASGLYGYFPSYALGNLYDGMFLKKLRRDVPDWKKQIKMGNFQPVKSWMIENVHSKGDLYDPADLIKVVCGESLNTKPFLSYLDKKYSKIYGY
jgi:carboxypeptidase Taq